MQTDNSEITISVIMGVFGPLDRDRIQLAVDSVLHQDAEGVELLICDDGCIRETADYLRELAENNPQIRLFRNEKNCGLAYSLNVCIEHAQGRFVARMDADDVAVQGRFSRQVAFLEEHPEYGWCGTGAWLFEGDRIWGSREYPEVPQSRDFLRFSPYNHPSVMFRREVLEKDCYCVSSRTLRCEDYELFMRLQSRGLQGYNLREHLMCYREDRASYGRRTFRNRWNEFRARCRGFRELGLVAPVAAIRPLVGGVVPNSLIAWLKKKESNQNYESEDGAIGRTVAEISGMVVEKSGVGADPE